MIDLKLPWTVLHPRKTPFGFQFKILDSQGDHITSINTDTLEEGAIKANSIVNGVNQIYGAGVDEDFGPYFKADPGAYGYRVRNTKENGFFNTAIADQTEVVAIVVSKDVNKFNKAVQTILKAFNMKPLLFLIALLCRFGAMAQGPTMPADVVKAYVLKVYDGDGCRAILPDGKVHVLRFAGVDAPEFENLYTSEKQPYSTQSRDSMRALILHDSVYIHLKPFNKKRTSYHREVVDVYLMDGRLVNLIAVQRGWAWARPISGRTDTTIADRMNDAYLAAKKAKVGLWGMPGYKVLPATWRFRYKREQFNHFQN